MLYNTNETSGQRVKWNKPVTKEKTMYYSSYMKFLEWPDPQRQKGECQLPGVGEDAKGN